MKTKGEIGLDNCGSVSGGVDFGLVGGNLALLGGDLGLGCSFSGSKWVGETGVEEWGRYEAGFSDLLSEFEQRILATATAS